MECAYKYRIYPNKIQQEIIAKNFGCTRYVYNYYLNIRIEKYKNNKECFRYNQCCNNLTQLKKEKIWLKEADSSALQSSLKDLDDAYKMFFKKICRHPKFKSKKNRNQSYTTKFTYGNIQYLDKHIKLPKLGYVKTKNKLIPQGRILHATISQEPNGHYYCSLCCTDVKIVQYQKTNKSIGIDLGIADFAILSDGSKIENPRFYEKSEKKLAKLQRELSRKTIGSSNWNKARIKVAKLNKHIQNQRNDFLQKLTTELVKQYDVICIEDLKVSELKETGSSLKNKRLNDVSWYEFRRKLIYKANWHDKNVSVIDRWYPSSQICHYCNHITGNKPLDIREWDCPYCGEHHDRDINAAINILNEGLRLLEKTKQN